MQPPSPEDDKRHAIGEHLRRCCPAASDGTFASFLLLLDEMGTVRHPAGSSGPLPPPADQV